MTDKKIVPYQSSHRKEDLPDMCKDCVHHGDEICEECLKEYYEKLEKND